MSKIQTTQDGEVIQPCALSPRGPRSVHTPLGDRSYRKAKLSIGPNGEQIAEPGEEVDLQAYIQASRASTDMATIIARYKAGDETVLNAREGFYGDVTIIPSSVNDFDKINKLGDIAAEKFAKLPDDIKAAFGNDSATFLNAVMENKVDSILKSYEAKKEAPKTQTEEN